jgi:hypothetical protein
MLTFAAMLVEWDANVRIGPLVVPVVVEAKPKLVEQTWLAIGVDH